MKKYLYDFMVECDYLESDRDFLISAYEKIVEGDDTRAEWERILKIYDANIKCDYYKEILVPAWNVGKTVNVHPYTSGLLIFMCMSKRLKELYIERGISLEIFKKSMLDLKYKLDECKTVRGIIGSFVAWWFPGFFNLTRFGLGRLQFEISNFGHEYEKNGHKLQKDSKVIGIHIPRDGTPFDEASCIEAYKMAKEFFTEIEGEEKPFVCHSWLLYPKHEEILNHNSNTYKFFSRFDVFEWADNEGEDLWRLFDTEDRNPDRLPTNTSFRRNYVEHLKKGGLVGWGHGVFFF